MTVHPIAWHVIEATHAGGAKPAPEWRERLQCPRKAAERHRAAILQAVVAIAPVLMRMILERR